MPLLTRILLLLTLCLASASSYAAETDVKKIGVLLVNHGSRSATWRQALLDVQRDVTPALTSSGKILGVKTAFMEYTEPSIATQLKAFDEEGYTDVIIVPLFLTVSAHTFDDIPTIIGRKVDPSSLEMMRLENIERYTPRAHTILAPNLDFPGILKDNVLRRVKSLSNEPDKEALVLIAYGDETYEKQWIALLEDVAAYVKSHTGIPTHTHGWCGHIAHYKSSKTTEAINAALGSATRAIVIPVLVAHDENFQIKIIGGGIDKVKDHETRVAYRPDAILPEPAVNSWVVSIANQYADLVAAGKPLPTPSNP